MLIECAYTLKITVVMGRIYIRKTEAEQSAA